MLKEKIEKTISKFRMLNKGDKVLVGVSGGPDSVCLLYLLYKLKESLNLGLHVCHLNHKLRGKDSDDDASFVKDFTERLGLPFYGGEIDVKEEIRKRGWSEEEGARFLRYEFFFQNAENRGIRKIAVGHTRDDQVETVLMHLVKGAGILGLRGIPPVREEKSFLIIRPLFEIWREEIMNFLHQEKIGYRIDKTNFSSLYLRNRIRNKLIPYLINDYNPRIKEILANTAENLGLIYEYINKQGRRKFNSVAKVRHEEIMIILDKFRKLHPVLQREIFRLVIKELKGNLRRINYQHWKEFEELFQKRSTGSMIDLPQGISVEKDKKSLIFFLKN
ncbi:MAG: tRNA lysidine(34) synthetase TilS [Candidatus Omnitrophica bacterium]|nr:tRNA lysidine(34) synthetase TilS [Candidatus Omnitrophota bacterium]